MVLFTADPKLAVTKPKQYMFRAFHELEKEKMHDVLNQYCLILALEGVFFFPDFLVSSYSDYCGCETALKSNFIINMKPITLNLIDGTLGKKGKKPNYCIDNCLFRILYYYFGL